MKYPNLSAEDDRAQQLKAFLSEAENYAEMAKNYNTLNPECFRSFMWLAAGSQMRALEFAVEGDKPAICVQAVSYLLYAHQQALAQALCVSTGITPEQIASLRERQRKASQRTILGYRMWNT